MEKDHAARWMGAQCLIAMRRAYAVPYPLFFKVWLVLEQNPYKILQHWEQRPDGKQWLKTKVRPPCWYEQTTLELIRHSQREWWNTSMPEKSHDETCPIRDMAYDSVADFIAIMAFAHNVATSKLGLWRLHVFCEVRGLRNPKASLLGFRIAHCLVIRFTHRCIIEAPNRKSAP